MAERTQQVLLAACKATHSALENMTTEEFARGGDRAVRDQLREAIREAEGKMVSIARKQAGVRRMYRGENEILEAQSRLGNLIELLSAHEQQCPVTHDASGGKERAAYIEAISHVRVALQHLVDADVELAREELNPGRF